MSTYRNWFLFFIVPIVAAQGGIYNKVITIKDTAVKGVNTSCIVDTRAVPWSTPAYTIPKVAITASLAAIPENNPTAACHVPNPAGLNIGGAINRPICPNILFCP